ncbi:MAG: hypothetical protein IPM01_23585 [Burkholderiaceae bacterium]|nr:hypothetical protein [Burkholderiaceae bacterium]
MGRRVSDGAATPIIPDCCNLGITARILVPLNLGALLVAALTGATASDMLVRALAIVAVLEPVAVGSLVMLCVACASSPRAVPLPCSGLPPVWRCRSCSLSLPA